MPEHWNIICNKYRVLFGLKVCKIWVVYHSDFFMNIRYRLPPSVLFSLAFDALAGRQRSFREDALTCIKELAPSLHVLGQENIPTDGPCVVTVNHYFRQGFFTGWIALAIAATVPVEIHWVTTGEMMHWGKLGSAFSRWGLQRIGRTYGFTTMPPMPPRPQDVEARAIAVKKVLRLMKQTGNTILGLAPEGADQTDGRLTMPPEGTGRFGLLLADSGFAFVSVGVYEADGTFCLRFGPKYHLSIPSGLSHKEKDIAAAKIMMQNIANLLPEKLRGELA